jgi:hypothetical protein
MTASDITTARTVLEKESIYTHTHTHTHTYTHTHHTHALRHAYEQGGGGKRDRK